MTGRKAQKQRRNQAKRARVEANAAKRRWRKAHLPHSRPLWYFRSGSRLAATLAAASEFRRRVTSIDWPRAPSILAHQKACARGYVATARQWRDELGPVPLP